MTGFEKDIREMAAREAMYEVFEAAVVMTLKCGMCGTVISSDSSPVVPYPVVFKAYNEGWTVEDDNIHCQYCKDNKR